MISRAGRATLRPPGDPAVQNDLTEVDGVLAGGILVALAHGKLVEQGQEHGVDHAQAQGHDLVAEDGGPGTDGSVLGNSHVDERAAGDQNHGDQDGQESGEGAGHVIAGDQDILHIVGRGLLDLSDHLGQGLDPLLVGPLAQQQPGEDEGDDGDQDAPADHQAQVGAQQNRDGQDAGGGGDHGVGQVQAGLGKGGHLAHGDVLSLGKNVGNVGGENGGDVTKHGDRDDIGRQSGSQLQILAPEELDEEVGDGLGGAGVLHAHGQDRTEHDGDAHAAQGAAEAGGDHGQDFGKGKSLGLENAHDQTHDQSCGEQRERGVQLDLHDQDHQQRDGEDQKDQETDCRHMDVFSLP